MVPPRSTVSIGSNPSITCPILIAAKVTADMAITLKTTPKYNDLNPLRKWAGFPP